MIGIQISTHRVGKGLQQGIGKDFLPRFQWQGIDLRVHKCAVLRPVSYTHLDVYKRQRIWVRVPLIANINDDVENMDRVFAMSRHLESVERVELLPYHEYGVGKYAQLGIKYQLEGLKPPTESKIEEILKTAAKLHCGLDVIVRRHE